MSVCCNRIVSVLLYSIKFWWGKTLVNLVNRMSFARCTKVAHVTYCKFANIFLDLPKFYPAKILRYMHKLTDNWLPRDHMMNTNTDLF